MKRILLALASLSLVQAAAPAAEKTLPFTESRESLAGYRCPDWFRDAKLGIWAHWGPQAVPEAGDWYARQMFVQNHRQYRHHLEHFGHPSEQGMEAIFPLWHAEKWNPKELIALYKRAGARYFVSMGVHHDNFDLWDSAHNRWNAVKMGPKRDIVGEWAALAREAGLRFGVSEHLGASYTWYQTSHGADKTGPKQGVPYVGTRKDLEDLYHTPAAKGDTGWYTQNPAFHAIWNLRIRDLVDKHHPDLLYSDGGLPFGATGRALLAHYYNDNAARHGGVNEAVYNCKSHHGDTENEQFIPHSCVHDIERGGIPGIAPEPWQTDTSIGDWFYNRDWKCLRSDGTKGLYRDAGWVVSTLADVVSKNGNLLLNVVLRPDGSLDPEARRTVEDLADWMAVNGEAIHDTRPWTRCGEGPALKIKTGSFKEDFHFSASDIRFTTKGGVLYAILLGRPADGKVTVKSLAAAAGKVTSVELLGASEPVRWEQDASGLAATLPAKIPGRFALALKIKGESTLTPAPLD